MSKVSLVLCIHNHQPVGNLPGVFEHAYRHAYEPLLGMMEKFPEIRFVLHNTGPLLEWYEENAPDYIRRTRALVDRGQVEVLSGAFYEPILPILPGRDVLGQIGMMNEYIASVFGIRPRGMWLAERVWEPGLASRLAHAGIEYLPLDDYELMLAGVAKADLDGYFVTDDDGLPVRIFPISKDLRYSIPFREPEVTLDGLREIADRGPGRIAVFGDDGEKFGVWPGTYEHVYARGWLQRFLRALRDNADWIETTTFGDLVDSRGPAGRVYLPSASYPEMMEWALPTPARSSYERMQAQLADEGRIEEWGPFLSGGTWRGFVAKYRESNLMVRKMMRVSGKVERARKAVARLRDSGELNHVAREGGTGRDPAVDPVSVDEAQRELWRGQCNCAYWHGVFGGLYLPHLRSAVYAHLIEAENLVDAALGSRWSELEVTDYDLDGHEEVLLETEWANAYVWPALGGILQELDLREAGWNVLGTMSRYREAYHESSAKVEEEAPSGGVPSIHDKMSPREKGLDRLAVADTLPRGGAIDRFLAGGSARRALESGEAEDLGDFAACRYERVEPSRSGDAIGVTMSRRGTVGGSAVDLSKTFRMERNQGLRLSYELKAAAPLETLFTTEWNFAFLTGSIEYVRLQAEGGEPLAGKSSKTLLGVRRLKIRDDLRDTDLTLEFDPPCEVWIYPLETASQSEGGLERVFQGTTLVAVWDLQLDGVAAKSLSMSLRSPSVEGAEA